MAHDDKAEWIEKVLAQYEVPLLRFAAKLLCDGDRARDIVQETFLQLCEQDRAAVEQHLAAWLFRVCRNRVIDLRRKETRMERLEHDSEAADPRSGPWQQAGDREDAGHIMKVLETLPESQQEVVYLRFQGGLSYKAIAEVTGHSVTNVGFLLHAAVHAIRARLTTQAAPAARTAEGSR
jgi:RNA polymerase sigma-70 factor (ECF subfamily)